MKVFTPYEGCAEDIERLVTRVDACAVGGCGSDTCAAGQRLSGALSEPKCGKSMRYRGTFIAATPSRIITCTLSADHDGPHADETLDGAWS